jgi:hypothetical protein
MRDHKQPDEGRRDQPGLPGAGKTPAPAEALGGKPVLGRGLHDGSLLNDGQSPGSTTLDNRDDAKRAPEPSGSHGCFRRTPHGSKLAASTSCFRGGTYFAIVTWGRSGNIGHGGSRTEQKGASVHGFPVAKFA